MKTLLALAVVATASLTASAFANTVSDFDFSSQSAILDEGAIIDLDAHGLADNKPTPLPITRSINFTLVTSGHKPDEVFSKVTEAAKTICSQKKGHIRNLNYFAMGVNLPGNGGVNLLGNGGINLPGNGLLNLAGNDGVNRLANGLGVRVSCSLGK
jgi:hypothetical protein